MFEVAWLCCVLTVGVVSAWRLWWVVPCVRPVEPPALVALGDWPALPDTPDGGDALGVDVVVLVDSLEDEDEEEDSVVDDDVVVVEEAGPPPETGGLIVGGTAPVVAGHVSVTTVSPLPVTSATRRSQRRGPTTPSLADPSLINSRTLVSSRVHGRPICARPSADAGQQTTTR